MSDGRDVAAASEAPARSRLEPGDALGRYRIEASLGSGSTAAQTYLADDPKLGREVVLEVAAPGDARGERLIAEAQALAKLSHPNVAAIYDAGVVDGRAFVAMELVPGISLDEWCQTPRPWREVLAAFLDAGRGLAAVRAAGVSRLEFATASVQVRDDDSGAVVRDFELGRSNDAAADADGDQRAFCVSLYEALYRQRACEGEDSRRGLRPPPEGSRLPRRLWAVLERGLRGDPRSIDELIAKLEAAARRRWPARLAVTGAAAVALAIAGVVVTAPEPATLGELAGHPEAHAAQHWNDARKDAIEARFLAAEDAGAAQAFELFEAAVDSYVSDYLRSTREATVATFLAGAESPELFAERRACLDDGLAGLDVFLDHIEGGASFEPTLGVLAVHRLPPLARCERADVLASRVEPPPPSLAAEVDTRRRALWEIGVRANLGEMQEALAAATALHAEVEAIGYRPLQAKVGLRLASLQSRLGQHDDAEQSAQKSFEAAQAAGATDLSARSAVELGTIAARRRDFEEAERWHELARANAERLGDPPTLLRAILILEAMIENARGDLPAKLEAQRRVWEISRTIYGDDSPLTAVRLAEVASTESELGNFDAAIETLERSHAALVASVGENSDHAIWVAQSLGYAYLTARRLPAAARIFRAVLVPLAARSGPDSVEVATNLFNLGAALLGQDDETAHAEIVETLARASEIFLAAGMTVEAALADVNLASHLLGLDRNAEARALASGAVARLEAKLGDDHLKLATARLILGKALRKLHEPAAARELFERALAAQVATLGDDHPELVDTLVNLGAMQVLTGARRDGIATLERAIAIGVASEGSTLLAVDAMHELAHVLGTRSERSQALLEDALARLDRDEHPEVAAKLEALIER